ncbi:hypothetical protein ANANG_G00246430 [Anguilla anguilla]|uniref:WW domain-containing protein n=1 Tax=Anguilla anguilla TaxID=7936 RepID=A0A9D3LRJ0_ANGAN|nr:hypothetical protein ANANG_G00246430 [Anguilla anguilla]
MWAEIQQSRMYLSRSDVQQARYPAKLASKQTKSLYPRYCSYNVREMSDTSSDWVEILEPRSRERMYINLSTGECGWAPPANVPVRQSDGNQWWELFDTHNGRFYYYNSASRQTVWHRPRNCDVVPLARLQARKRSSESQLHGNAGLPHPDTAPSEALQVPPRCSHPLPPPLDPEGAGETPLLRPGPTVWRAGAAERMFSGTPRRDGSPLQGRRRPCCQPRQPASPAQSAMAASADCKQAFHLKKTEDGHFCPVSPGNLAGSTSGSAGRAPAGLRRDAPPRIPPARLHSAPL